MAKNAIIDVPHYSVWLRKYMPDTDLRTEVADWSDRECFMHTLRKYRGIRPRTLRAHGMEVESPGSRTIIHENDNCEVLTLDGDDCSLCLKYQDMNIPGPAHMSCKACPLDIAGFGCNYAGMTIWMKARTGDPEPMIKQMRKMIKECDEKGKWFPALPQKSKPNGKIRKLSNRKRDR